MNSQDLTRRCCLSIGTQVRYKKKEEKKEEKGEESQDDRTENLALDRCFQRSRELQLAGKEFSEFEEDIFEIF